MLAPMLEQVALETPNAKVVKINVDRNPRLAAKYGIRSLPSLVVFKDGQVAARHVGLAERQRVRELLDGKQSGRNPKVSRRPPKRLPLPITADG
jgi:thioredoxin 1